jgi:hypothetical protein
LPDKLPRYFLTSWPLSLRAFLMSRGKVSLQESSDDDVFEAVSPLPRKIETAAMKKDCLKKSTKVFFEN